MQKLTFLPTLFFICLQSAFSAEVHFSEKADHYTVKLKDIGEVAASATAVFSADGKISELEQEIYQFKVKYGVPQ